MTLNEKIEAIKADNNREEYITPRELINSLGYCRRSWRICNDVMKFLNAHEIELSGDLCSEWIDARLMLRHKAVATTKVPKDSIKRISSMAAANNKPVYVDKSDTLEHAVTLMQRYDYFQLPVISGHERNIIGHISWRTIGLATWKEEKGDKVSNFMSKKISTVERSESLLKVIKNLPQSEFVVVLNEDRSMSGIITTADITAEFFSITQAEAFLLLEQIELQIRNVLGSGNILLEDLQNECNRDGRVIESIDDLTFGEYIRIIENEKFWKKLEIKTERKEFVKFLHEVREVRNDVMHFEPDGICEEKIMLLRNMARFLTDLL